MKKGIPYLFFIFIFLFFIVPKNSKPGCPACSPNPAVAQTSIMVGNLAGGQPKFLKEYIGDKPAVLSFWASYCKPCANEMPELQMIMEKHKGAQLFFINIDKSSEKKLVEKLVKKWGIKAPVLLDNYQIAAKAYVESLNVPATFIIVNGKIQFESIGYSEDTLLNLENKLNELKL